MQTQVAVPLWPAVPLPVFPVQPSARTVALPSAVVAFLCSPERNIAVKLHGSPMCLETRFGAPWDKRVSVRAETSRATYNWVDELAPPPAGASAYERAAFAEYHVARYTAPADAATRARRAECLVTWYEAVEAMTGTPIADLLVHGDVVVRMCENFSVLVGLRGELTFGHTHARDVRDTGAAEETAAEETAADETAAVAAAMGYAGAREFLAAHRIVGVEASVGATGSLTAKRKYGAAVWRGRRKLRVVPVNECASPGCAEQVGSIATAMALCKACARRLGGVFHAQTRSFRATRAGRLREVRAARAQPTMPMFVDPPGVYHLPDDVAAHVLYVVRLCKERVRPGTTTLSALARGIVETPSCALGVAGFRPGLEALYARLRLRRALVAAYAERRVGLRELCDRFCAGKVGLAHMVAALAP
jgi:hypothetical protein